MCASRLASAPHEVRARPGRRADERPPNHPAFIQPSLLRCAEQSPERLEWTPGQQRPSLPNDGLSKQRRSTNLSSILETATIEKQRKELQLLIGELKDRDKELNGMVAEHQRQQLSWEGDRQKVLTLEERCSKLENELHKRSEIIRTLTKRIKILECQQNDRQVVLETTQMQLQELAEKAAGASLRCEELEGKNHNLNSSVMDLSAQVGQLQAREQALTTMISLKDKDIIEAVNHIVDCSSKFKLLEHALCDAKVVESCIIKEKQDYKQKLKALKFEMNKLRDDLSEKIAENNEQREEIIRLKQEKSSLHDELIFTGEREKRKEQLLEIAKSKQERTDTQLHNLRQIYVKQQSDLQFLHFNMENSQELMQTCDSNEHDSKVHETSQRIVSLHSRCLGSPLISTLKKDKLLKCKQFHEADLPSETNNSCEIHSDPKSPVHQDDCSPTSKLQHLLEESRQMVANLELSTMLPIRLGSPSSSPNTTSELAESKEICKTQLPATDGNEIRLARFSI